MDAKYGPSVVLPISIEHGGTGKTNVAEARSALKTVTSDSSAIKEPIVNIEADNSMFVRWKTEDGNIYQIKGDINQGMRYEKKINGTWTTIPVDVTRGGTGATTADAARSKLDAQKTLKFAAARNPNKATVPSGGTLDVPLNWSDTGHHWAFNGMSYAGSTGVLIVNTWFNDHVLTATIRNLTSSPITINANTVYVRVIYTD